MTTPADRIREVLTDPATPRRRRDGWLTLTDLTGTLTVNHGLSHRDIDRALTDLADELEWTYGRPVRVRLLPARARQLTLGGDA